MSKKLYVGGLSYATTDGELQTIFEDHGSVLSATVITDRETGRSRGFGFVEMSSEEEASNAINQMDGKSISGRNIMVNEARDRASNRSAHARW